MGLRRRAPALAGLAFLAQARTCIPPCGFAGGMALMIRFAGYAAVFDRADRSGDVVRPGAFARTLVQPPRRIPLLWQHDISRVAGEVEMIAEDRQGLRVIGRVDGGPVAQGTGLSFGYRVKAARGVDGRELTELELVEVSLVTTPMQPLARVHAVE